MNRENGFEFCQPCPNHKTFKRTIKTQPTQLNPIGVWFFSTYFHFLVLDLEHFDLHKNSFPPSGLYNRVIHEVERPLILKTLSLTNGNQIKASELLGLNRNTLRKKISYLDIQYKKSQKKNK